MCIGTPSVTSTRKMQNRKIIVFPSGSIEVMKKAMLKTTPSTVSSRNIWIHLILVLVPAFFAFSVTKPSITFVPSKVVFDDVSRQFPLSWQRRLLSSVPVRDYALQNVSLVLESHQLVLIQGASSSGKSTLLQAVLEPEQITSGQVYVVNKPRGSSQQPQHDNDWLDAAAATVVRPIYLDQRPPLEGRRSMQRVLEQDRPPRVDKELYEAMVDSFAVVLGLMGKDDDCWMEKRVLDLSPSETYRFAILRACLQSTCGNVEQLVMEDTDKVILVPAPIILLDEWMDTETSTVIQATQKSLVDLVRSTGGLVCVVTHKVDRWKADWVNRSITLCRGQVLSLS